MADAQAQQQRPRLVLQALDLNKDGSLSPDEIQAAPKSLLVLDLNGDGQLNFVDELSPRRQDAGANPEQLVELLMKFDKNGDGVLTPDELPERMQALFVRADANKDGKLTPDEIRQSAGRTAGPRGRDAGDVARMLRLDPLIDVLDADHDGVISAAEIQQSSVLLLKLDKNHDGTISFDEMVMRQQSPAERAAHVLSEFDTNHDGKLSRDEVPDGLRARFDDADKNGDGFLDANELQLMFAAMPAGGFGRRPEGQGDQNSLPNQEKPKGSNR
jgi:Ca2+-binding EF-hand superfamily protein